MKNPQTVHSRKRFSRNIVNILGVHIDSTSTASLLRKIEVNIGRKNKFYIVTPNPEIVMASLEDEDLKYALNHATVSIPDGVGLVAAKKFLDLPNPKDPVERFFTLLVQGLGVGFSIIFDRKWLESDFKVIRGREFFLEVVKLANKKGWKIFLLGGEGNEATGTKSVLERNFKNIKLRARRGPMLYSDGSPKTEKDKKEEDATIEDINEFSPDMLFVCFDFRKQEKWLYRHYKKLNITGGMVLGGTFKYLTGMQKLPPKFMADTGLEWLWRLLTGSQKGKRIWSAVPRFSFKIFLTKLLQK